MNFLMELVSDNFDLQGLLVMILQKLLKLPLVR